MTFLVTAFTLYCELHYARHPPMLQLCNSLPLLVVCKSVFRNVKDSLLLVCKSVFRNSEDGSSLCGGRYCYRVVGCFPLQRRHNGIICGIPAFLSTLRFG